jgi:hypothetical protein
MTAKRELTKKSTKGKADRRRAADELTAERIRAILSDPATRKRVRGQLEELTYSLYAQTNAFSEATPDSCAADFFNGAAALREQPRNGDARAVYEEIVRFAEQNEPIENKVARRVRTLYDAQDRREGPKGKGCHFFMENYVDPLLEESSDNFICGSPRVELFPLLFVRAAREYRGAKRPNRWTDLLAILDRAETEKGFDFEKQRGEDERRMAETSRRIKAEELAKPEPEDKTSSEWRIWKLRQLTRDLREGDEVAFKAARLKVASLIGEALGGFERGHVGTMIAILPDLLSEWQEWQRTREQKAAKKSTPRKRK